MVPDRYHVFLRIVIFALDSRLTFLPTFEPIFAPTLEPTLERIHSHVKIGKTYISIIFGSTFATSGELALKRD